MIDAKLMEYALDAARDGVVISDATDPELPIVYVNPAFESITGYSAAEVLGKNCRFLQGEDVEQDGIVTLRGALRAEKACLVTLRNYRKNGSPFWNELSISPVKDDFGRVTHFIGIQKDVSVRVRALKQLEAANGRLERLKDRYEKLADRDPLTDVHNRRYFDRYLETEWRRAARRECSLACFLVDIDEFKRYNDHYGHQAGDRCLVRVAQALAGAYKRAGDVLARYGGEEFVALSPDLDLAGALEFAERVRAAVADLNIEHAGASAHPRVTVSIGVAATVPTRIGLPADLVAAADRALYAAKNAGRNRVERGLVGSGQ